MRARSRAVANPPNRQQGPCRRNEPVGDESGRCARSIVATISRTQAQWRATLLPSHPRHTERRERATRTCGVSVARPNGEQRAHCRDRRGQVPKHPLEEHAALAASRRDAHRAPQWAHWQKFERWDGEGLCAQLGFVFAATPASDWSREARRGARPRGRGAGSACACRVPTSFASQAPPSSPLTMSGTAQPRDARVQRARAHPSSSGSAPGDSHHSRHIESIQPPCHRRFRTQAPRERPAANRSPPRRVHRTWPG